ncbi:MAG: hypothetical protein U1E76_15135 [Planctomycetota bacterium]
MTELPIQRFLLDVIEILDRLGIHYAIMGGFAVRTWGVPRPTYDADLAIAVDDQTRQRLLQELAAHGFDVPEEHAAGFVDTLAGMGKLKVTRFAQRSVWQIDFFLASGGLLAAALQRRRRVALGQHQVWVVAPEELILLELIAFRRKDQLDLEEIFQIVRDLDASHLRQWAKRLDLTDRLRQFLPES